MRHTVEAETTTDYLYKSEEIGDTTVVDVRGKLTESQSSPKKVRDVIAHSASVPTKAVEREAVLKDVLSRRKLELTHSIANEEFTMILEDSEVTLSHKRWSLMGSGATLLEAELDLLNEAKELVTVMVDMPVSSLSVDAWQLRNFVSRVSVA